MLEFGVIIFVVVLLLLVWAVKRNGLTWLSTKDGKGILSGLILAPALALILVFVISLSIGGCTSNRYIEVYAGVEGTKKLSPMCDQGGASDRLTSNIGLSVCDTASKDKNTLLCASYRHHSCAITADDQQYDAFGVQVARRIYF